MILEYLKDCIFAISLALGSGIAICFILYVRSLLVKRLAKRQTKNLKFYGISGKNIID